MRDSFLGSNVWLILAAVLCGISQVIMRWGGKLGAEGAGGSRIEWLISSRWWFAGLALSWFAGLVWAWTLRSTSLAYAFPVYTGLVYVLTLLGGWLALREGLRPLQLVGAVVVLVGVLLIMLPAAAEE